MQSSQCTGGADDTYFESSCIRRNELPNINKTKRLEWIRLKGVGFCYGCNRIGPLWQLCEICNKEDDQVTNEEVQYVKLDEVLSEHEGICPKCYDTGNVEEMCKQCTEWFYVKLPDRLKIRNRNDRG